MVLARRQRLSWLHRRRRHNREVGLAGSRVPLHGWAGKADGHGAESPICDAQDGRSASHRWSGFLAMSNQMDETILMTWLNQNPKNGGKWVTQI
jgi:hypothetical protein